jgi:glycerol-3-phosphate dehydrogenase
LPDPRAREISIEHALAIEPFLNPKVLAAIRVPDGVFEPFRFCLAFLATARQNGAVVRTYTEVTDLLCSGKNVTGVKVQDHRTGEKESLPADLIVNAAGPWAGEIAAKARVSVPEVPTAGVMVALDCHLNNMVLNRLNKPSDGDIVVPQRATSVIGTTSWAVEDPDLITIPPEHVDWMISHGVLELLFLLCVTTHALLGVRAIFLDLGLSQRAERRLDLVLKIVGVLTGAYGLGVTFVVIR